LLAFGDFSAELVLDVKVGVVGGLFLVKEEHITIKILDILPGIKLVLLLEIRSLRRPTLLLPPGLFILLGLHQLPTLPISFLTPSNNL
jgi:hypothetical protein